MATPDNTDDTDADLVAATLAGHTDAYGALVQRHQRRVYLGLLQLCRDRAEAEDLTQEAFVRAYRALASFDPAYRFPPWLFRIAINLWRNSRRRAGREVALEGDEAGDDAPPPLPDGAPSPEAQAEAAELRRRVWRAVDALPAEARRIVVMRHAMELSYEEIAAATDLPMGTVKSRLARARQELAVGLRDLAGE
jgi:RNA polymerase sigma-70 factor, ECF subfamily